MKPLYDALTSYFDYYHSRTFASQRIWFTRFKQGPQAHRPLRVIWKNNFDPWAAPNFREAQVTSTSSERFRAFLLSAFSLCALIMSSVGIYGTTSYVMSGRRSEIGI